MGVLQNHSAVASNPFNTPAVKTALSFSSGFSVTTWNSFPEVRLNMNFSCLERTIASLVCYCEVPGIAALPGYRRRISMDAEQVPAPQEQNWRGRCTNLFQKQYLRREPWGAVHGHISHWFDLSHVPLGVTLLAWRGG